MDFERYQRQLALPEITVADQARLSETRVLVIGAGGLGSAALPYLAGAGIGHITVMDDDVVSRNNLHRQVVYKDENVDEIKINQIVSYLNKLNPDIEIIGRTERFDERSDVSGFDLLIDGSDNFETKSALNKKSVEVGVPMVSASVQQFGGQVGVFAGYAKDAPCYHCLFPELPEDACNCNDAGVLGSVVGVIGTMQAHVALCLLLGLGDAKPGFVLSFDLKGFRFQKLILGKDASCAVCHDAKDEYKDFKKEKKMADMLSLEELNARDHVVVDVRTAEEIAADPIKGAKGEVIHMEVSTVPARYEELPSDTLLAFVCAGNVRSVQAAEYLEGIGFEAEMCVLDKFSIAA